MVRLRVAVFANHAVANYAAPACNHHVAVFKLASARHAASHLLKALAVGGAQFG